MYYIASPRSKKTQHLVDFYLNLLDRGVDVENILVIPSNAFRRLDFLNRVKGSLEGGYPFFKIYTFHGIVYNTVNTFWPLIEKRLNDNHEILPVLTGLETCEFIIKDCIKQQNANKKLILTFEDFYGDRSLVIQLIRRYRLMAENMLSFNDLLERSQISGQKFGLPANEVLKLLKKKTSDLRILDFVTQMNAFNYLISSEDQVKEHFKQIKYLIVDDLDENTTACQYFIKRLLEHVEDFAISYDPDGGTRRGYLSAYSKGCEEILSLKPSKKVSLKTGSSLAGLAESLYSSIKEDKPLETLPNVELKTSINRTNMFNELYHVLDDLIFNNNIPVDDINIVIPALDSSLKLIVEDYCLKNDIRYQFLTGSHKPVDNPAVFGTIILIQLLNNHWKIMPTEFDVRRMLIALLHFPPIIADRFAQEYEKSLKKASDLFLPNLIIPEVKETFNNKYRELLEFIESLKEQNLSLYDQFVSIFKALVAPSLKEDDSVEDFNRIINSLKDFMDLKRKLESNGETHLTEKDWLMQVKNELMSENPVMPGKVKPDTLVIATPQKIVDMEIISKYQVWVDVSSAGWTRTQTAALYNGWVFSNYYDGTLYDDVRFTHSLAAHLIRNLVYYCDTQIIALASNLDAVGYENQGWLIKYLGVTKENKIPQRKIELREDQKAVMNYSDGTMSIAAVPGSGKTFINVVLVVKLIESGVNPENILVLTYMDSAARTLINRIKKIFPDMKVLPQISTIHGLAYKIIRDDDNLSRLGLPDEIGVADETIRPAIIDNIVELTLPEFDDYKKWKNYLESGISLAKSFNLKPGNIASFLRKHNYVELKEFYKPYKMYFDALKSKAVIDFDDQIRFAIELLEKYPDIRKKYQDQYHYIIEDEAQDSTKNQQKLLSLLLGKNKNYIRTGDFNQAIMTTFTPVDVEGFRKFIQSSQMKIEMNKSQRCTQPVVDLANELIEWSKTQNELKNSFLDIKMIPVNNSLSKNQETVHFKILKTSDDEMEYVAKNLSELMKTLPKDTRYAVLTRSNPDAIRWTKYLDARGFECICYTDNIQQRKDFNLIYSYLKVIHKPYNNKNIKNLYDALINNNIIESDSISHEFIKSIHSPFISFEINELPTNTLAQLYMDILYWLEYAHLSPSELIVKLSKELFDDIIDRSNGYIISTVADKYRNELASSFYKSNFDDLTGNKDTAKTIKHSIGLPEFIKFLDGLNRVKGFKFIDKDEENISLGGFIQIMTVHKAKGMGFDVVFIPHLWERGIYYPTTIDRVVVDAQNKLELQLMEAAGEKINPKQYEQQIKQKQLEETLRLIYVAITRSKQHLFMTSSEENTVYSSKKAEQPSRILEYLITNYSKNKLTTIER